MDILVLGGCGQQGSIVAKDLSRKYKVSKADLNERADVICDLSEYKVLLEVLPHFDLVVGALPSALGMTAMMAAIDSSIKYVDMSFMAQDVTTLNTDAVFKKTTILHDCGIAPGLSHLIAGRAIHAGADSIAIYVGGVAADPKDDYVLTWSVDDLIEEYIRPARIIKCGSEVTVPALSKPELIETSIGTLEAFYTDGLRSLLSKQTTVKDMEEKTMRWPGHTNFINSIINTGTAKDHILYKYAAKKNDVLVLKIIAGWQGTKREVELVVQNNRISAMARATALSCSAFAQLVADNKFNSVGVISPEDIASNDLAYRFILDCLSEQGIMFDHKYPFMEL